jgi:hypothetical protein
MLCDAGERRMRASQLGTRDQAVTTFLTAPAVRVCRPVRRATASSSFKLRHPTTSRANIWGLPWHTGTISCPRRIPCYAAPAVAVQCMLATHRTRSFRWLFSTVSGDECGRLTGSIAKRSRSRMLAAKSKHVVQRLSCRMALEWPSNR